jgi:hypothetical protein
LQPSDEAVLTGRFGLGYRAHFWINLSHPDFDQLRDSRGEGYRIVDQDQCGDKGWGCSDTGTAIVIDT